MVTKAEAGGGHTERPVFTYTPHCCTAALSAHTGKAVLRILQVRLQQYTNHELPDVQAGFRKGRGTGDQIANTHWIIKRAKEFQKNIYF